MPLNSIQAVIRRNKGFNGNISDFMLIDYISICSTYILKVINYDSRVYCEIISYDGRINAENRINVLG